MRSLRTFALAITVFTSMAGMAYALPAFPGAEGFGSTTKGGRGGKVIHVTNLNNSGPGSFRAAVEASGPRIIVFDVAGYIDIAQGQEIVIDEPYVTIAGQTAPGDGITFRGESIGIKTHDVILRGVRIRAGLGASDVLHVLPRNITNAREVYNVIIDHCSLSWSPDENFGVWYDAHDITLQRNIISEGLGGTTQTPQGKGALFGSEDAPGGLPSNISFHHNLMAHNADRSIRTKPYVEVEMINNLIYGWNYYATRAGAAMNIIGNHYIKSPATGGGEPVRVSEAGSNTIYVLNNIGPGRPTNTGAEWDIGRASESSAQASSPTFPLSNVTIDKVEDVYDNILADVGVTAPAQDDVDIRIINDVIKRTGTWDINNPNEVGGYPTLDAGTNPKDTDNDGMPDSWETARGLNPSSASDANGDDDGDGYTNIEEYINSFYGDDGPPASSPAPPQNLKITSLN